MQTFQVTKGQELVMKYRQKFGVKVPGEDWLSVSDTDGEAGVAAVCP
jgi:hypothetical protein